MDDAGRPDRARSRVGVFRVGGHTALRSPAYARFPFERRGAGFCPCCGEGGMRATRACPRCGNARSREELGLVPENVVLDVESLESSPADPRLQAPIESPGAGPVVAPASMSRSIAILAQKGGGWSWPISPGRN